MSVGTGMRKQHTVRVISESMTCWARGGVAMSELKTGRAALFVIRWSRC